MKQVPSDNPIHLAVVSPCSACKNQAALAVDGKPACPRRAAQSELQSAQAAGVDTSAIQHLALFGTEGTAQEGNGSLLNPVYSSDLHAILVWVALLIDNGPLTDRSGNQISPNILDPSFDTSYIQCRSIPVTPRDNEAAYFQKGAFAEMDQLEVSLSAFQQMTADSQAKPLLIGGTTQKMNFIFNHPRTPVNKDLCPSGT
jgi:hypothetical protein